jgi:hypothetical protein
VAHGRLDELVPLLVVAPFPARAAAAKTSTRSLSGHGAGGLRGNWLSAWAGAELPCRRLRRTGVRIVVLPSLAHVQHIAAVAALTRAGLARYLDATVLLAASDEQDTTTTASQSAGR